MPTPIIPSLTTYTAFTTILASTQNTNLATIRDNVNLYATAKDVANTFTAIQTFSVAPVFSAGLTVSASGLTVTGNSTITGTLGGITTLTATTVTATSLGGTITTASQPNITTLAGLTTITVTTATIGTTTGKIIGGSTSLAWRNNADSADVIKYTESSTTLDLVASALNLGVAASTTVVIGNASGANTSIRGVSITLTGATGGTFTVTGGMDMVLGGAIATNATQGFIRLPSCAGAPTGAAGATAFIWNSTDKKLGVREGGTWYQSAAFT